MHKKKKSSYNWNRLNSKLVSLIECTNRIATFNLYGLFDAWRLLGIAILKMDSSITNERRELFTFLVEDISL